MQPSDENALLYNGLCDCFVGEYKDVSPYNHTSKNVDVHQHGSIPNHQEKDPIGGDEKIFAQAGPLLKSLFLLQIPNAAVATLSNQMHHSFRYLDY